MAHGRRDMQCLFLSGLVRPHIPLVSFEATAAHTLLALDSSGPARSEP